MPKFLSNKNIFEKKHQKVSPAAADHGIGLHLSLEVVSQILKSVQENMTEIHRRKKFLPIDVTKV
jgi:hypothetical protein